MKRPSRLLIPFLVLLLTGLLAVPARGQEAVDAVDLLDTDAFRFILKDARFEALSDWQQLGEEPGRSLLVLLGDPLDRDHDRPLLNRLSLLRFLEQGGAVLLATDDSLDYPPLTRLCGYGVAGVKVSARSPQGLSHVQDREVYRGLRGGTPDCLIVQPCNEGGPALFQNVQAGLLAGTVRLVTNAPSYLVERGQSEPGATVAVLAQLPKGCWYKRPISNFLPEAEPFALSCKYGKGRLLLLADPSVFTNEMMRQNDTGNVEFTYSAVNWLKEGRRDRVLFVRDGAINTNIRTVRLSPRLMSLAELQARLVDAGDQLLQQVEDSAAKNDTINRTTLTALNDGPGRGLFGRASTDNVHLFLVLLAGAVLAVYGLESAAPSHRIDPHLPLFALAAARQAPSASVLQQRHRLALQEDNLGDYAHLLAREWLAGVPEWRRAIEEGSAGLPRVLVRGGWWRQHSLRRLLAEVWRLAQGQTPEHMTKGEFRRLVAKLDRLRQALDVGTLCPERGERGASAP